MHIAVSLHVKVAIVLLFLGQLSLVLKVKCVLHPLVALLMNVVVIIVQSQCALLLDTHLMDKAWPVLLLLAKKVNVVQLPVVPLHVILVMKEVYHLILHVVQYVQKIFVVVRLLAVITHVLNQDGLLNH